MLTVLRFIFKLFWKVVGIVLTVYLGLAVMLVSTISLQQQFETEYRSVLIKPLVNAENFEQWDKQTRHYIHTLPKQNWVHSLQMRLTYPGLHSNYLQIDHEIGQLKKETLELSKALNAEFSKNPLLKRTWELMVLKHQNAQDMEWSDIANSIGSFIKSPKQQSQVLSEYSAHTRRIALLGQNLMKQNHRLQSEAKDILPINTTTW